MNAAEAAFYYDFSSPYSYLAASRIDGLLPGVRWRPIVFGALIREIGKVPWSMKAGREAGMQECEQRAAERGLPPLRWPEGWPAESYSVLPLRAALAAEEQGRLREFSAAAYRVAFADGRRLDDLDAVLDAAEVAGLEREAVQAEIDGQAVKSRLRANTSEAVAAGVTGVPTVAVAGRLFWGDDRLEEAAAAVSGSDSRS